MLYEVITSFIHYRQNAEVIAKKKIPGSFVRIAKDLKQIGKLQDRHKVGVILKVRLNNG